MTNAFKPQGRHTLIGSMPLNDHREAIALVNQYVPEIPVWIQLPALRNEGMVPQFAPGLPGVHLSDGSVEVDTGQQGYDEALVAFFEAYLDVTEGEADLASSRFCLTPDTTPGFFAFCDHLETRDTPPAAIKGQITGPITFTTGIFDQHQKAIFYDEQLRDAAVKLIALKARWQVQQLRRFGDPVIIFFDEPSLAGFGSSEFISITHASVKECFGEVINAVHAEGGLAGIHVCANTDWSLILDSGADIVNFDAFAYFDRFVLYAESLKKFMTQGGILAWGIVPTQRGEDIQRESVDTLFEKWQRQCAVLETIGVDPAIIVAQSLITPSCGLGSQNVANAERVLELTRGVAHKVRSM